MKKLIILLCLSCVLTCACGKNDNSATNTATEQSAETQKQSARILPDLSHVKSICNLATLECYYHNVAKSVKESGSGLAHQGEEDRVFWIEYTGIAKIGIDISEVKMEVDGDTIVITLPKATLISLEIQTPEEDNYIAEKDKSVLWYSVSITAEDQTAAISSAQEQMEETVESNTALLTNAEDRAKKLIENYITQIGNLTGSTYTIEWKYAE